MNCELIRALLHLTMLCIAKMLFEDETDTESSAWIPNTELTPLTPEECKDVPEKGKQKALKEAYEIAAKDNDLAYFKNMLGEHAKAMQEDEQLRAEKEAEKEAKKARQAKRKSTATVADDDEADEMDVDEEGEPKPKASKKRKKSLDSEGEEKVSYSIDFTTCILHVY